MNELNRNDFNFSDRFSFYSMARPQVVRETLTGDYFIPSSVLRKIVIDLQSVADLETGEALDSLIKIATQYELFLKGTN